MWKAPPNTWIILQLLYEARRNQDALDVEVNAEVEQVRVDQPEAVAEENTASSFGSRRGLEVGVHVADERYAHLRTQMLQRCRCQAECACATQYMCAHLDSAVLVERVVEHKVVVEQQQHYSQHKRIVRHAGHSNEALRRLRDG